jgi:hypothetical protein
MRLRWDVIRGEDPAASFNALHRYLDESDHLAKASRVDTDVKKRNMHSLNAQYLAGQWADAYIQLARHDLERRGDNGRWAQEARSAARRCLDEDPGYMWCVLWALDAELLSRQPNLSRALALAQRAVNMWNGSGRSHQALAEVHRHFVMAGRKEHLSPGLKAAARAVEIAPDLALAQATRGRLELLAAQATSDPGSRRTSAGRALAALEQAGASNPLLGARIADERRRAIDLLRP